MNFPDKDTRGLFCLDDVAERLTIAVHVSTPPGWTVVSHAGSSVDRSDHDFAPVVLSPNMLIMLAGPWVHAGRADALGEVPVDLWTPTGLAVPTEAVLRDVERALRGYRDDLGLVYPLEQLQICLVPGLPLLGVCVEGLMLLSAEGVPRLAADDVFRASVLTHELGHTWIGGQLDFVNPNPGSGPSELVEGLNTWVARTALAAQLPGLDPWSASLDTPDQGLYAGWATRYRVREQAVGTQAVLARVRALVGRHVWNATADDAARLVDD